MDMINYLERVTVIFNPDGTVRGSEAHEHTGYLEERDVPDAPGAKQQVFVVVKPEVRPIEPGDLATALDGGCPAIEDAAVKAEQIRALSAELETAEASIAKLSEVVTARAATIEEQAGVIAEREAALAEAAKREGELREAVQRLSRENGQVATELAALRAAAAQEPATVE